MHVRSPDPQPHKKPQLKSDGNVRRGGERRVGGEAAPKSMSRALVSYAHFGNIVDVE